MAVKDFMERHPISNKDTMIKSQLMYGWAKTIQNQVQKLAGKDSNLIDLIKRRMEMAPTNNVNEMIKYIQANMNEEEI
jgi:hypothetical protein